MNYTYDPQKRIYIYKDQLGLVILNLSEGIIASPVLVRFNLSKHTQNWIKNKFRSQQNKLSLCYIYYTNSLKDYLIKTNTI